MQRIPVKIVLDDHSLAGLLRPGMSVEPTIDTKATVLAERESKARLAATTALSRSNGELARSVRQHYQARPDNPFHTSSIIEVSRLMYPASAQSKRRAQ